MKKVFLCQIPMKQPEKAHYQAEDNQRLQFDEAFSYPVLMLIKAYALPTDQLRIVLSYNNHTGDLERIEEIREGLRFLREEIGFSCRVDDPEDFISLHQDFKQSIRVTPLFDLSRQIDLVLRSQSPNPDELLRRMLQL